MDVRHEMRARGIRPIAAHKSRVEALGRELGVKLSIKQERIPGGSAHGGVMAVGVRAGKEFIPIEIVKKASRVEQMVLRRLEGAGTTHIAAPRIIEMRPGKVVMDYVPGERVAEYSRSYAKAYSEGRAGKAEQLRFASLFDTVARGLRELHSLGITKGHLMGPEDFETELHGGNLLLGEDGRVYWVDFSAAKLTDQLHDRMMDLDALFHSAFEVYGAGEKAAVAKAKRALDVYFEEGASPKQFLLLERIARTHDGSPLGDLAAGKAREILSSMPKPIREDFLRDFWAMHKSAEYVPPEPDRFRDQALKRNVEWLGRWTALLRG